MMKILRTKSSRSLFVTYMIASIMSSVIIVPVTPGLWGLVSGFGICALVVGLVKALPTMYTITDFLVEKVFFVPMNWFVARVTDWINRGE